jgi:hypothetical protein
VKRAQAIDKRHVRLRSIRKAILVGHLASISKSLSLPAFEKIILKRGEVKEIIGSCYCIEKLRRKIELSLALESRFRGECVFNACFFQRNKEMQTFLGQFEKHAETHRGWPLLTFQPSLT